MKKEQMFSLTPGQHVCHKRYGACVVTGCIPDFGLTIRPITAYGKAVLSNDAGVPLGTPLLETHQRNVNVLELRAAYKSGADRVKIFVRRMRAVGL